MDQPTLIDIERAAVRAWPALETEAIGGWLWRFSSGGSQRANSVAALDDPGCPLEEAIARAEALYAARGAPAQFQVTQSMVPAGLDAALARRGYRINDVCTTLVRRLDGELPGEPACMTLGSPSSEWFETYAGVITESRRAVAPTILARVPEPRGFCALVDEGRTLAVALVVVTGTVAIVECVAARAEVRRRGAARRVMVGAMAFARQQGAQVMALGAVEANTAAQGLYARLGFTLAGRYHMRIRDGG